MIRKAARFRKSFHPPARNGQIGRLIFVVQVLKAGVTKCPNIRPIFLPVQPNLFRVIANGITQEFHRKIFDPDILLQMIEHPIVFLFHT